MFRRWLWSGENRTPEQIFHENWPDADRFMSEMKDTLMRHPEPGKLVEEYKLVGLLDRVVSSLQQECSVREEAPVGVDPMEELDVPQDGDGRAFNPGPCFTLFRDNNVVARLCDVCRQNMSPRGSVPGLAVAVLSALADLVGGTNAPLLSLGFVHRPLSELVADLAAATAHNAPHMTQTLRAATSALLRAIAVRLAQTPAWLNCFLAHSSAPSAAGQSAPAGGNGNGDGNGSDQLPLIVALVRLMDDPGTAGASARSAILTVLSARAPAVESALLSALFPEAAAAMLASSWASLARAAPAVQNEVDAHLTRRCLHSLGGADATARAPGRRARAPTQAQVMARGFVARLVFVADALAAAGNVPLAHGAGRLSGAALWRAVADAAARRDAQPLLSSVPVSTRASAAGAATPARGAGAAAGAPPAVPPASPGGWPWADRDMAWRVARGTALSPLTVHTLFHVHAAVVGDVVAKSLRVIAEDHVASALSVLLASVHLLGFQRAPAPRTVPDTADAAAATAATAAPVDKPSPAAGTAGRDFSRLFGMFAAAAPEPAAARAPAPGATPAADPSRSRRGAGALVPRRCAAHNPLLLLLLQAVSGAEPADRTAEPAGGHTLSPPRAAGNRVTVPISRVVVESITHSNPALASAATRLLAACVAVAPSPFLRALLCRPPSADASNPPPLPPPATPSQQTRLAAATTPAARAAAMLRALPASPLAPAHTRHTGSGAGQGAAAAAGGGDVAGADGVGATSGPYARDADSVMAREPWRAAGAGTGRGGAGPGADVETEEGSFLGQVFRRILRMPDSDLDGNLAVVGLISRLALRPEAAAEVAMFGAEACGDPGETAGATAGQRQRTLLLAVQRVWEVVERRCEALPGAAACLRRERIALGVVPASQSVSLEDAAHGTTLQMADQRNVQAKVLLEEFLKQLHSTLSTKDWVARRNDIAGRIPAPATSA